VQKRVRTYKHILFTSQTFH